MDATGDAQSWTTGTAITPITVPVATGTPTPTYAVKGTLPAGITVQRDHPGSSAGHPRHVGTGTITIEADNSEGTADWTVDYTTSAALVAPSFADNTGDPQSWTQGTAITDVRVPNAAGNPTPTYAVQGALPAGINFDTNTLLISGTPSTVSAGTIRIRASNSEGNADWTVTFTTASADTEPDAPTISTVVYQTTQDRIRVRWNEPDDGGEPILDYRSEYHNGDGNWQELDAAITVRRSFLNTPARGFTYSFRVRARNSVGNGPYSDTSTLDHAAIVPNFADDTGDAQAWTVGTAITGITVPAATGDPTPTYAAVGTLPTGIAFNTTTRVISGTPTVVGSGTITIRATNSGGEDDWTVDYTTSAALVAPVFSDPTGDAQAWTQDAAIAPVTVPAATGNPTPTYRVDGTLPAGIAFNATTRVISGTPTALGSGTITIEASNSEGLADWTVTYAIVAPLAAPSFADDTGDAQSWTQNQAITDITVPAASGNPVPAYAAVGTLPAGIQFNATTRVISGTPTAVGNGTIRIRATNSEGDSDWTVAYTTAAPLVAPSFTDDTGDPQTWTQGTAITPVTVPAANGTPTPSYAVVGSLPGRDSVQPDHQGDKRNAHGHVGSGTVTVRAMNSEGQADWTVAFTSNAPLVAPSFVDNTGDAQAWTVGTAITPITVPAAAGNPAPTYAVEGTLPDGLAFNTTTRVVSGTPTTVSSGTITIRAANSEGHADWTVDFTTVAALAAPVFADDTGDVQTWTHNQAIAPITVPSATGNPTPTYAVVGSLPVGIQFDTTTLVLSGTPTSLGSGTITIRATNSEGDADWTVDFTTTAALTAPSFADSTGDAQTWTQNVAITDITVPAANGNPSPTYAAVGALPTGISFDTGTRVLSGTPTVVGNGTITIRATNSEGMADWTVAYTTGAPLVAPAFADDTGDAQTWTVGTAITDISVPSATGNPTPTYAAVGTLPAGITFNADYPGSQRDTQRCWYWGHHHPRY